MERLLKSPRLWVSLIALVTLISSGKGQQAIPERGDVVDARQQSATLAESDIARVASAGDVIGFSGYDASGTQIITLVNTEKSWMAVYHISSGGEIRLVSSRPIDADFSLQLNVTDPLPDEIRGLSNQ